MRVRTPLPIAPQLSCDRQFAFRSNQDADDAFLERPWSFGYEDKWDAFMRRYVRPEGVDKLICLFGGNEYVWLFCQEVGARIQSCTVGRGRQAFVWRRSSRRAGVENLTCLFGGNEVRVVFVKRVVRGYNLAVGRG